MAKIYKHLTTQERAVVMTMRADLCSTRAIAKRLCRSASTISRELKRTSGSGVYDTNLAHAHAMPAGCCPAVFPSCTRTVPCCWRRRQQRSAFGRSRTFNLMVRYSPTSTAVALERRFRPSRTYMR